MNRLQELQQRDAAIVKLMAEINDKVAADNRLELSEEESAKYEGFKAERESLAKAIKREEEILAAQKDLLKTSPAKTLDNGEKEEKLSIKLPNLRKKLVSFTGEDAKLNAYKAGQFLLATLGGNAKSRQWCEEHGVQCLAQSEGVNSAGGYLVPDEMAAGIIDLREQYGVFRREARVVQMSGDSLYINRRVSGLTAYWVGEGTAITDSSKVFDQVQLVAKKLGALTYWSSEVNEDALINWADDLSREMAYAFALKEDQCGFVGDGTSTYGGIFGAATKINDGNHAASIKGAATGNVSFETLDLSDFNAVVGALPQFAGLNAKWYISMPGYANSMQRLEYAGGGNTTANIAGGTGMTFLGYPVVISQVLNTTLGSDVSAIKCLFGDLRMAATLGDRRGISVAMSDQVRFTQDQMAIKGTERFDIFVHDLGDGTNAGPIVALKTAAS